MHTQVIMGVFFWAALVLFACWIVVELMEVLGKARRQSAIRSRLGLDEHPGASAWEERMRIEAADTKEGAGASRRG
jgi:hypothetical protein